MLFFKETVPWDFLLLVIFRYTVQKLRLIYFHPKMIIGYVCEFILILQNLTIRVSGVKHHAASNRAAWYITRSQTERGLGYFEKSDATTRDTPWCQRCETHSRVEHSSDHGVILYSAPYTLQSETLRLKGTVPYRHGGGWSKKINAWYLNTLMVYL